MICIETFKGKYVVRQGQVATTAAATVLWTHLTRQGTYPIDPCEAEEFVACLKGQDYCYRVCRERVARQFHSVIKEDAGEQLTITCSDGTTRRSVAMLRRRFHLVDDYLTEHPEEKSIKIPYTVYEVSQVILASERASLRYCYACLCHLNPKDSYYPFLFNLESMTLGHIDSLYRNFTEEEQDKLIQYAMTHDVILPSLRMPYLLAVFPTVSRNSLLMETVFLERYPSYLFCTLVEHLSANRIRMFRAAEALFTWDFSIDQDGVHYSAKDAFERVEEVVDCLLGRETEISMEALAAKMKKPIPLVLPYGISIEGTSLDSDGLSV